MEVNQRINYPIKRVLINMTEQGMFRQSSLTDYCISWFVIQVANIAVTRMIASWNNHPIPGVTKMLIILIMMVIM